MTDMERLFRTVEGLNPDELQQLRNFIEQRQRTIWWIVTPEQIAQADAMLRPLQKKSVDILEVEIDAAGDET